MDDRLRLLAHWHARRREVDELLAPLLAHGPAAVDRVTARLQDLTEAMDAEGVAFAAFAAAAPAPDEVDLRPPVDEVALARQRAAQSRVGEPAAT